MQFIYLRDRWEGHNGENLNYTGRYYWKHYKIARQLKDKWVPAGRLILSKEGRPISLALSAKSIEGYDEKEIFIDYDHCDGILRVHGQDITFGGEYHLEDFSN